MALSISPNPFGSVSVTVAETEGSITVSTTATAPTVLSMALGVPGPAGAQGPAGSNGTNGTNGVGVPTGGTTGQALVKASGTNYDTTWASINSATWGNITGTLSSQTDLQNALDGKLSLTGGTLTGNLTLQKTYNDVDYGSTTNAINLNIPSSFDSVGISGSQNATNYGILSFTLNNSGVSGDDTASGNGWHCNTTGSGGSDDAEGGNWNISIGGISGGYIDYPYYLNEQGVGGGSVSGSGIVWRIGNDGITFPDGSTQASGVNLLNTIIVGQGSDFGTTIGNNGTISGRNDTTHYGSDVSYFTLNETKIEGGVHSQGTVPATYWSFGFDGLRFADGSTQASAFIPSNYLTASSIASTYLSQSSAASTYLSQSSAASTYAPLASPTFTGDPKAPTPATTDNDTSIATTAFVQSAIQSVTAGSTNSVLYSVRNATGSTLTAGTVVYINGATGNKATVAKAAATSDSTSAQTLGMVTVDIPNNTDGNVTVIGTVSNLNTFGLTEGTQLYLGTTPGTYTTTKPYAPTHLVYVGVVTRAHNSLGTIQVKVQNGYEMDELHNVSATSPANANGLFYNTSTSLWEAKSVTTALGYAVADTALSNLSSASTARTNLGLGSSATNASTVFAQVSNNLSDLASASTARTNLGLGSSATNASTVFAQVSNNLSDLANATTARTNLGLGSASTLASSAVAQTANNLSDLANAATARTNLGLGTASTNASTAFLLTANNLSDVTAATARTNLGLAYATDAQMVAGTSASTVLTPSIAGNSFLGWTVCGTTSVGTATSTGTVTTGTFGSRCTLTASASGQYAIVYPANGSVNTFTTSGTSYSDCNFSKRIKVFGRVTVAPVANLNCYYAWGRSNNTASTIGNPAAKGFGIRIQGTGAVELQVHNGTTLTNVTSSFTPTSGTTFDCLIDSIGDGNVNLYINGSLVATSSAGATGTGAASFPLLIQEISSTASSSAGNFYVSGKAVYFA